MPHWQPKTAKQGGRLRNRHLRDRNESDVRLTVRTPEGEQTLIGSHLLVAVGRTPNTERLNLRAAGVETNTQGFIKVNDRLETNVPGVYAIGDVNGGPQFTHISYDDFRIIRANLIEGGDATTKDRLVPYTVFIDPQLGRVGLTETEARKRERRFIVPVPTVASRAERIVSALETLARLGRPARVQPV